MAFSLKLIFSFLFLGGFAQAEIVGEATVGGASNAIRLTATNWRVYGSFAGPEMNSSEPYNSCELSPGTEANFVGCNLKRITENTVLIVNFNEGTTFTAPRNVLAYIRSSTSTNPVTITNQVATPQPGPSYVARLLWGDICRAAGGKIDVYTAASTILGSTTRACLDNTTNEPLSGTVQLAVGVQSDSGITAVSEVQLEIRFATPKADLGLFNPDISGATPVMGSDGFQPNVHGCNVQAGNPTGTDDVSPISPNSQYTGYCDYKLLPGDESIRMVSDQNISNHLNIYPSTGGTIYAGFVLYLSGTDFTNTLPWQHDGMITNRYRTQGVLESGFEKSEMTASLIKNEVPVFTRMATLDEANNVTHLFSSSLLAANCGSIPTSDTDPNFYRYFVGSVNTDLETPPFLGRCPYATVPSLVTGLLSEDVNCFVATALTGSPYHYQVLALREFRNRFLKSFSLGRSFIEMYYDKGPLAAKWLHNNPQYKPFFRVLLWPAYFIANVFNVFGALLGLVLVCATLLLPIAVWNLQRKTFFQR